MNRWCEALKIAVPRLEAVKDHRDASTYTLLLVALLERGESMTLDAVAARFDEAGIAPHAVALQSLKRCRPARDPVYRDGDLYDLDAYSDELDLWAFRLDLRGPKVVSPPPLRLVPKPLGEPEDPLSLEELEEATKAGGMPSWSVRRLAVAILDANGASLPEKKLVEIMDRIAERPLLNSDSDYLFRRGSPFARAEGGVWKLDRSHDSVLPTRAAVRQRIEMGRRYPRQPLSEIQDHLRRHDEIRAANAAELEKLRRVLVCSFPVKTPAIVALVDVETRAITTFMEEEVARVREVLTAYDVIGAIDIRPVVRGLGFDPEHRRIAELGPAQKTYTIDDRGRTLKLTSAMLVQGSCGISKPFGEPKQLQAYLDAGDRTKLRQRLESDAKSLYAVYQYGRLHRCVRLRWGFVDERIPAPWTDADAPSLYEMMRTAYERGLPLEVVIGNAPSLSDLWGRVERCHVEPLSKYDLVLVTPDGRLLDQTAVQLARIPESHRMG